MANQYSNSFQDRRGSRDGGGVSLERVPSCFQSFDESHVTRPPTSSLPRPSYTAQQKDEAIRLLDKGTPIKAVMGRIGAASSSEANPYRWRAELRRRQRARQEWRRAQRERVIAQAGRIVNLMWVHFELLLFLLCLVGEILAIVYLMDAETRVIWVMIGRVGLLFLAGVIGMEDEQILRIFEISIGLFWIYQLYGLGVYLFG